MEVLSILEQKVVLLVELIDKLQKQNEALRLECEELKKENSDLRTENAHFVEENMQIAAKLQALSFSAEEENKELNALHQEKKLTEQLVDDLIKSIESLVEKETQL